MEKIINRITASIVLYNTPKTQIETVMKSIIESEVIETLYVIDNAENVENKEYFLHYDFVEYIPHVNTGYGSSHNIALHKAIETNSVYHVVLNPDIEFDKNVLSQIRDFMNQSLDTVYVLPKVIYPDGTIQKLCKLLPTPIDLIIRRFLPKNNITRRQEENYTLVKSGYNRIINPPCLSGCFMFLRVSTLKENNIFFDDSYFMYLEDFDLIRRLHRVGKTLYYPSVTIIHNHAKESYKNKKMLLIHIKSAIKYFNKYGWFFDKERKLMNNRIREEILNLQ